MEQTVLASTGPTPGQDRILAFLITFGNSLLTSFQLLETFGLIYFTALGKFPLILSTRSFKYMFRTYFFFSLRPLLTADLHYWFRCSLLSMTPKSSHTYCLFPNHEYPTLYIHVPKLSTSCFLLKDVSFPLTQAWTINFPMRNHCGGSQLPCPLAALSNPHPSCPLVNAATPKIPLCPLPMLQAAQGQLNGWMWPLGSKCPGLS